MNIIFTRDEGSFRDPGGYVFISKDKVIRAVNGLAADEFSDVVASGLLDDLINAGLMIPTKVAGPEYDASTFVGARGEFPAVLYEHDLVHTITYPYEWVFSQLKDAALAHLDIQIAAFAKGFVLSDASAYNIQFNDGRAVHIDPLSLKRYVDGQHWEGYNQFCRQFLLPLLIEAWSGLSFQALYRGSINGISFSDALAILPKHKFFLSLSALLHVYLHGRMVLKNSSSQTLVRNARRLPREHYISILKQLRLFIAGLESSKRPASYWSEYAQQNSYSEGMRERKLKFVRKWATTYKPATVWDIGGNTGDFSRAVLDAGVQRVVLIDSDVDSIEAAYRNRKQNNGRISPLLMNLLDPSPDLGWRQRERKGLNARTNAEGMIALAVIHHMVIGGNLPLKDAVDWLISLAPIGVIEFVPKRDPMVSGLLAHRQDIYHDYNEETFREIVASLADITDEALFDENGRLLISYKRKQL